MVVFAVGCAYLAVVCGYVAVDSGSLPLGFNLAI